jgi:hypothetical protein
MPRSFRISEELTRKEMIDPQYEKFTGILARIASLRQLQFMTGEELLRCGDASQSALCQVFL